MLRTKKIFPWLAPILLLFSAMPAMGQTHQVAPGDTLYLIAQRYGTTVDELMRQNGLSSDLIYPGQTLWLGETGRSSGATHRVSQGESLYLIARRYGTTVEALKSANGLTGDYIEAGWELTIPAGSARGSHQVQPGESLYLIAQRYGTTVDALVAANGLTGKTIYPGQTLIIPAAGGTGTTGPPSGWYYTVKAGDTLYLLAIRYGTTVQALREANGIYTDLIYPGQRLLIPDRATKSGNNSSPAISPSEEDLLARLVSAEAAGEPYAGQVAVAATILNRLRDPKYPKTITEIIYQYTDGAYQYSPVMDGRIEEPATETAKAAVRDALNGWDPSCGATGFYNPAKTDNPWVKEQPVTAVIGNHVFFKY